MKHRPEIPNAETVAAMEEGMRIAYDPNVRGYRDMEKLKAALLSDASSDDPDQKPSLLYIGVTPCKPAKS